MANQLLKITVALSIIIAGIRQDCIGQIDTGSSRNFAYIDTMCYSFAVTSSDTIQAFIPQLRMPFNTDVAKHINKLIFKLSLLNDEKPVAPPFIKPASLPFKYNNLAPALNYREHLADTLLQEEDNEGYQSDFSDSHDEFYEVNYLGETFLSIGYQYQTLPYRGQYQFFYSSLHFNLRNGDILTFADFFSIHPDTLAKLLVTKAVIIERYDQYTIETQKQELIRSLPITDHINTLFNRAKDEEGCCNFFFHFLDGELYLCFKIKCAGPHQFTIGIKLSHLKDYVIFPEFKNKYNLWGKNAKSLIGANISELPSHIDLEDYVLNEGGGYLLPDIHKKYQSSFSIQYANNKNSLFYFFTERKPGQKELIVIDVLELKKDFRNNIKIVDSYCYSPLADPEIIAKVKYSAKESEYYNHIIEAWRANRLTYKFEIVNPKQIVKCVNESYGTD